MWNAAILGESINVIEIVMRLLSWFWHHNGLDFLKRDVQWMKSLQNHLQVNGSKLGMRMTLSEFCRITPMILKCAHPSLRSYWVNPVVLYEANWL